jgi:hypothetical protein
MVSQPGRGYSVWSIYGASGDLCTSRNRNRRLRLLPQCAGSHEYHSCANGGEHTKPSHDYDGNFGECDSDSSLLTNAISRRWDAAVFMEHYFGELACGNPTQ